MKLSKLGERGTKMGKVVAPKTTGSPALKSARQPKSQKIFMSNVKFNAKASRGPLPAAGSVGMTNATRKKYNI